MTATSAISKFTWKRDRSRTHTQVQVTHFPGSPADPAVLRVEQGSRVIEFGLTLSELANLVDTLHSAYSDACRVERQSAP